MRFILLVLLQVMVLNHIQWNGYINPYIYILFILLLPVNIPKTFLLTLGFVTGISIDMFSDTGGLHAAATVALCFARPGLLKFIAPRDDYDVEVPLTPQAMGFKWFLTYLMLATTLHHLLLFYLEIFRFDEFFITFLKSVFNVLVSVSLMLLLQYLFGRSATRNERING
ncbi:MAG: rod shape-determining protein MreD [Bacteroidota bacterium]